MLNDVVVKINNNYEVFLQDEPIKFDIKKLDEL